MKVLVVDDNPVNLKLIRVVLQQQGHEVQEACDGEEAVTVAGKEMPDLILMDIQMPVLDGIKSFHKMQADPALTNIPVVAVTSYAMKGDRKKFMNIGFTDYISKPVDIDILLELMDKHTKRVARLDVSAQDR